MEKKIFEYIGEIKIQQIQKAISITGAALEWTPHGSRRRARPTTAWRRNLEKEL